MADLVQDYNFIYSRLKTPFTWYEGSITQASEAISSLQNGAFTSNINAWTPSSGSWAWNAATGGVARWNSGAAVTGTLTQIFAAKPKMVFTLITVKAISGGYCSLNILNSVTGGSYTTGHLTATGTYSLTGVGDKIQIIGSGAVTIDVDDVELVVLDNGPQLNENRAYCKDECPYKLHTGAITFLNFALIRKHTVNALKYAIFVHEDGTTVYFDATQILSQLGITAPTFQDRAGQVWDYFIYHGQDHTRYLKCGYWKGWVTDGIDSLWLSETFYVGEYGYDETPGNNILANGSFDSNLSGWTVTGGAWTWGANAANGSGTGACIQNLPFSPVMKKVKFRIKVLSLTSSMAMFINNTVTSVASAAKVITTPGVYDIEGYGDQVYFSCAGMTLAVVDDAEAYIANVNPNLCHTKLTWKNSCDLFNIPYSDDFTNVLYVESPALTVAPGWKEELEVIKDGAGREQKVSYRKMKEYLLETSEIPEYVYDALALLNAHNFTKISLPVYSGQKDIVIAQADLKNDWLEGECYAIAQLRLMVEDYFDTTCCDSLNYQVACKEVCLTVGSLCMDPGGACSCSLGAYYLQDGVHEIMGCYLDGQLSPITNGMIPFPNLDPPYDNISDMFLGCTAQGEVLIQNIANGLWYIWYGVISYPAIPLSLPINNWKTIYEIISLTDDFGGCVTVVGLVPYWTNGYIEVSTNGVDWTVMAGPLTQAQLAAGYQVCGLDPGDTMFRIRAKNLNCDYGAGASEEILISFAELVDSGDEELRDDGGTELRDV